MKWLFYFIITLRRVKLPNYFCSCSFGFLNLLYFVASANFAKLVCLFWLPPEHVLHCLCREKICFVYLCWCLTCAVLTLCHIQRSKSQRTWVRPYTKRPACCFRVCRGVSCGGDAFHHFNTIGYITWRKRYNWPAFGWTSGFC